MDVLTHASILRRRAEGNPPAEIEVTTQKTGYTLNHQFNDNWQIRNALAVTFNTDKENFTEFTNLVDDRFLEGDILPREYSIDNYFGQIDLLGKFGERKISRSPFWQ